MKPIKTFTGILDPLDRSNIDTYSIIPKEYLKSIKRTGFGKNLFDSWRYLNESSLSLIKDIERQPNPDFVLNLVISNEDRTNWISS